MNTQITSTGLSAESNARQWSYWMNSCKKWKESVQFWVRYAENTSNMVKKLKYLRRIAQCSQNLQRARENAKRYGKHF